MSPYWALAENRPAIYRMTDAMGRVIYVGKAKRLRTRLLTYFRAEYPEDKAARILYAAGTITWDYVPSEFAAYLGELRQIRKYRPHFNYRGNVTRRSVLIKISNDPAPRVYAGATVARDDARCYGPFRSMARTLDAVRTLNDLLGLRDCTTEMPAVFAGQGDLFDRPLQAGCMRHEFGFCSGPCAGFVTQSVNVTVFEPRCMTRFSRPICEPSILHSSVSPPSPAPSSASSPSTFELVPESSTHAVVRVSAVMPVRSVRMVYV
jgi:excinuclease ABC subunit C